ncbi:capsule biosynthesis protein [Pedobacter yonginense]|uniref:Capsule biosynthesis protein n=1 Tax=Pedobacter yonginense TaxID=651869 RepID=A0A317EQP9_9SPHI|nr:SLBB domain-containing protein [Pedobacter yonginense]PWS28163.1 capsule biosynthesis protein [Pedobacter yonginense]
MKQRINILLSIIFFSLLISLTASAQNYANVKVDELSDAQILQLMKKAESAGYNDAQLEQMAAAQGMKSDEIQKLRLRVDKVRKQGSAVKVDDKPASTGREMSETTDGGKVDNEKKVSDEEIGPKIFGSELFRNGNITFEPNLRIATPKGYVIGPDDKLLIDLTGDNEASYNLQVSADGIINLQYVGRIAVGGLTIEQATSKIRSAMAKTYPSLGSGRTSLAINLGNIRSIKVILTGQLVKPGTYTLSSLSTVYNALYASGGPSQNGSFRTIQLIRNNRVISTIDIYSFLLKGIQQSNIRLQDQDVINVPVFNKRVEVTGEVKRSALFEVVNGESLKDVLDFAGGFTTQAYTAKVKAFQNTDRDRKIVDISAAEFSTYQPQNGDKYIVEAILDRFQNRVEIIGAVFRPGVYELDKGLTLRGLINKSDGLTEDAFLNRGYINRLNPDNTQSLISFDVAKIIAGTGNDISLQREDKITISSLFDLRDEYKVSIQGEVRAPGTFEYADGMTLESIIQLAGGFKEGATPTRIEISRRVKNSQATLASATTAELFTVSVDQNLKIEGEPFILKPFDIISIRNSEGYSIQKQVKLEGEVVYPGTYTITRKDEKISELIKRAGGLTSSAYPDGASLKRPGAEKVNPNDKNAINNKDEDDKKFLNLKRAQEAGVKDTVAAEVEQKLIQSDLVGINLVKILANPNTKYDLIVEDGDIIRVPRTLQTVKVTGEVLNPNSIVYLPGKSLRQYINGAGGFTSNARKAGVYVKYANGSAAAVSKFIFFNNNPIIKPGAEILVPKRAGRERLTAQSWIGIGTAVASLGAIIVSLLR